MGDSRVQKEVEAWVRDIWLREQHGCEFSTKKVMLKDGGEYKFNAVNDEQGILVSVCTGMAKTASGNLATGKMHKIRSDVLYLIMANANRRLMVFTERCMLEAVTEEQEKGRLPRNIECFIADLPHDLYIRLNESRSVASAEVSKVA